MTPHRRLMEKHLRSLRQYVSGLVLNAGGGREPYRWLGGEVEACGSMGRWLAQPAACTAYVGSAAGTVVVFSRRRFRLALQRRGQCSAQSAPCDWSGKWGSQGKSVPIGKAGTTAEWERPSFW